MAVIELHKYKIIVHRTKLTTFNNELHSLRIDELMIFLHSSFNSRQQEKQEPQ